MSEEVCIICLEDRGDGEVNRLEEKFGCSCKQIVHEQCLTMWILREMKERRVNKIGCILCRSEVGIDMNEMDEEYLLDRSANVEYVVTRRMSFKNAVYSFLVICLMCGIILIIMQLAG